ncbi:uncharacterized protein LOC142570816 [Dermacentor variabilis]|uniref:uncharacterized protein LOC142570816 n=1 Tax=Dermacentor variabilis TaxID=34621 RepID=UPI003F5C2507
MTTNVQLCRCEANFTGVMPTRRFRQCHRHCNQRTIERVLHSSAPCFSMTGCSAPYCTNHTKSGKAFYAVSCGGIDVRRRVVWVLRVGRDQPAPKGTTICEVRSPCLQRRHEPALVPGFQQPSVIHSLVRNKFDLEALASGIFVSALCQLAL